MNELESLWGAEPVAQEPKKYVDIPTGNYQAQIDWAGVNMDRTPRKAEITYSITNGEFMGRKLFASFSFNETGTQILKKELSKLGYNDKPKSFDELNEKLKSMIGKDVSVFAKQRSYQKQDGTQGTAHNVYINNSLSNDVSNAPQGIDAKEELPF